MSSISTTIDPKIRFIICVPDWRPEEATPFQGFSFSLCQNSGLLRFIRRMPTDIFELTPDAVAYRIARRIAGLAPINWFGQSPRSLKSYPIPVEAAFTFVMLDKTEKVSDYEEWIASCPGPVTVVAKEGGHIRYSDLSFEILKARMLKVCSLLRELGRGDNLNDVEAAIASWLEPDERELPYYIGGHGTIFPNAAVLRVCGFAGFGQEPFARFHEGEKAHVDQIVLTTNTILDEREANPPSFINRIYPRSPDLNLYCPATYELRTALSLRQEVDRSVRRQIETSLRILDKQSSYSFDISSETQKKALLDFTIEGVKGPISNPIFNVRQQEIWLGTEAVSCLAASEIGAVLRLPNRLNLTRGLVRQFAQQYRADRPQILKRSERFRGVQQAIARGFPTDLQILMERSQDGIRVIADAHLEWLDVRGIPLGLRYNVSRIPVTPGNLLIDVLSSMPTVNLTPDDFRDILVISGLPDTDPIAKQFNIAFDHFGKQWREKLRIKFVRVVSRQEFIDAINSFSGVLMVFDGHGSHDPDRPGLLWLDKEPLDVWTLRGEVDRPPPIVILSACDTHAADRNHATVANGFLALGCRSVIGSVFPLHATAAAIFTARLLYRVSDYVPAAIKLYERSLTWLEVVSGMLRRQATTDILRHLETLGLIQENESSDLHRQMQGIVDSSLVDPFTLMRERLIEYGIPESRLDQEIHNAIAASSTISYLHLGRPEAILINSPDKLMDIGQAVELNRRNVT